MRRMASRLRLLLLCCGLVAAATVAAAAVTPEAGASAEATDPGLLSSLRYFEVVSVSSPSHPLSGPPAPPRSMRTSAFHSRDDVEAARAGPGAGTKVRPSHPHMHKLQFAAHGQRFELHLQKNTELFAPSYSESRQHWVNGVRQRQLEQVEKPLAQVEHCYYRGELAGGDATGVAAVNTCNHGFSGVVVLHSGSSLTAEQAATRSETFVIEPAHTLLTGPQLQRHAARLQSAQGGDINMDALHIVYKLSDAHEHRYSEWSAPGPQPLGRGARSDVQQEATHRCGVAHPHVSQDSMYIMSLPGRSAIEAAEEHARGKAALIAVRRRNKAAIPAQRYIELFVANDARRFQTLGTSTESRSANIANIMSSLYMSTPFTPAALQLVLVGQVTFFNQDPWNLTTGGCQNAQAHEMCVDKLLPTWNNWRSNPENTAPYDINDTGHLFSGYNFESSVLGYAGVGSMCQTRNSGGINQMDAANDAFNAAIGAHEIGHNLGMQHDSSGNQCPESGSIMNAVVDPSRTPTAFSSCSRDYYERWTETGAGTCLNNEPTQRYGAAVCGNGYVEEGEACDCGRYPNGQDSTNVDPDYCSSVGNPCCDALSCQFIEEAECSNTDACCRDCKVTPKSDNVECRAKTNECDLAETCDGVSSACPFDDSVGNGAQCELQPYGPGACFEGDCVSYKRQCSEMGKVIGGGPWLPCPAQVKLNEQINPPMGYCGRLYCINVTSMEVVNRGGPAVCTYFNLASAPELMADGIPCGGSNGATGTESTDKLCMLSQCVNVGATNSRYQWATTEWEKCNDCDTTQARNVSCVQVATGMEADEVLCAGGARPPTVQRCSDEELLCDHGIGGSVEFTLLGHTIVINSAVVMGASAGIFVVLMLLLHVCVRCVAKKPEDIEPNQEEAVVPAHVPAQQPKKPSARKSTTAARRIRSLSPKVER